MRQGEAGTVLGVRARIGWLGRLWERLLVACVIGEASASEFCGVCASPPSYRDNVRRICSSGELAPGPDEFRA